ncbi:MAG: hypothetical protein ACP5OG_06230 [Candidatus Nanoarchaeia archaeon]
MNKEHISDKSILDAIKKSNLIGRCIRFAKKGNIEQEVHDCYTSYYAQNSLKELKISFGDGLNYQGYGYLNVRYKDEDVFDSYIDPFLDYPCVDNKCPPLNIERGFIITKYLPGKWERLI